MRAAMNRRDVLRSLAALGALGVAGCGKDPTPETRSVPVDTDTLDALLDELAPYDWAALIKQVPGELEALRQALVDQGMDACADSVSGFGNEVLPGVLELLQTYQTAGEDSVNAALPATVQRIGAAAAALQVGQIEAELAAQGWDQGIGGDHGVDVMTQAEVDIRTVIVDQELHENGLANLALMQLRRDRQWVQDGCELGDTLSELQVARDEINSWSWPTAGPPAPPLPDSPVEDYCSHMFAGIGLIQLTAGAISDDRCDELRSALERSAYVLSTLLTWFSLLTLLIKGTMLFGAITVVGALFALAAFLMMLYVMSSTICRMMALAEAIAECE